MVIRASLEYGSFIFSNTSANLKEKLRKLQFQALRLALGYRMSTPTTILLVEACELPIYDRFRLLTSRYLARVLSINHHLLTAKLLDLINITAIHRRHNVPNFFLLLNLFISIRSCKNRIFSSSLPHPYLASYDALLWSPSIRITDKSNFDLSSDANSTFWQLYGNLIEDKQVFFTDGSKKEKGSFVGLAIHSLGLERCPIFKISFFASIFTAEALAINSTLDIILHNSFKSSLIFTDSLSVIKVISNCSPLNCTHPLITRLKEKLYQIS